MASKTINPTRMELSRLKSRRTTAVRGHKLLKDKRDELMRQFLEVVHRNKELRAKVESGLMEAHGAFTVAASVMSQEMLEQALSYPKQSVALDMSFQNIMSVEVPKYTFRTQNDDPSEIFPYGFAQTSGELDDALEALSAVFQDMLELAQVEKTMQLLASEIEKTRRRVNALEYVMIPEMETNIKYISMKLDENERSSTSRLMKVKDMMLEEQRQKALQKQLQREQEWKQTHPDEYSQTPVSDSLEAGVLSGHKRIEKLPDTSRTRELRFIRLQWRPSGPPP